MIDITNPAGLLLFAIIFGICWLVTSVVVVVTTDYIWDRRKKIKQNLSTSGGKGNKA